MGLYMNKKEFTDVDPSENNEPNGLNLELKSKETDMDERTEERHILAVEEDANSINVKKTHTARMKTRKSVLTKTKLTTAP